ncbi:MAG: hypothetical protein WD295_06435 [Bacteroidota bacterium]
MTPSPSRFFRILFVFLLAVPAGAQVSVIGELSQDRELRPGQKYEGVILVKNDTDNLQEAKVYQTDYLFFSDGTNRYEEAGTQPRSNARWVTFSPAYLTIPPRGTVPVNYTVIVPPATDRSRLAGTYWSMLMVEGIPVGSPESSAPRPDKKAEMGIMQTIRYGIQIVTHIPNTGTRSVRFVSTNLVPAEGGKRYLQIDLENDGEIGFRPDVYVELFDSRGVSRGKFPGSKYRIYPGTSVRQMIDISAVPRGTYKALIVVDTGSDDIFGAEYTVTF